MTAIKVKPATGVYLDTGFGDPTNVYVNGTAVKDGCLTVATDSRLYHLDGLAVKVTGNQGETGTAAIDGSGYAINTEDDSGRPIPGLTVHAVIKLNNQELTLSVTETLLKDGVEKKTVLPTILAVSNPTVGSPVRYV
jgi:hypothetical protein